VTAELIPEDLAESLPLKQREILPYTPLLRYIKYKTDGAVHKALDELFKFLFLFSEDCIKRIMFVINFYAEYD
jgi:hypothetical protein